MKKYLIGIGVIAIVSLVFSSLMTQAQIATTQCKTFNWQGWTQDQKNTIYNVSHRVLLKTSNNFRTNLEQSNFSLGVICFDTILEVNKLLTETTYLAEYDVWQNELAVANATDQAKLAEIDLEKTTNDFCYGELVDLDLRVDTIKISLDTDITNSTNIASLKTTLSKMNNTYANGLKKLARCMRTLRK